MAGRHVASQSSERTLALTILAIGTIAVAASLFGGVWVVRAGAVAAVLMAFAAVAVAWRELERERGEHRAEVKRQIAIRVERAEQHHTDSVAMIDRFTARADNLQGQITQLRSQLGAANAELSSLRGNNVWLRGEVAERQAHINSLTARLQELEDRAADNIVAMPRFASLSPSVSDIWADDEAPTMVDLAKLDLTLEPEVRKQA